MKILLKEDVDKLGQAGDVVAVADGFARNYLIPKQLAVKASESQLKQVNVIRRQAQRKRERIAAENAALSEKLTGVVLTFVATASEKGRLYGSITQDDIAEALEERINEAIDRRRIETDPLRQIGFHLIPIRITAELIPEVTAIVHREGEDPLSYIPTETDQETIVDDEVETVPEEVDEAEEADEAEAVEE